LPHAAFLAARPGPHLFPAVALLLAPGVLRAGSVRAEKDGGSHGEERIHCRGFIYTRPSDSQAVKKRTVREGLDVVYDCVISGSPESSWKI
jgi:hypothetical protein